jgi:hypothetical protein
MGFPDAYTFDIGSRDYLHRLYGLDVDSIVSAAKEMIMEDR